MKQTLRIAKTELQTLFYSPIAWFILVIFIVHTTMMYLGKIDMHAMFMQTGNMTSDVTFNIFSDPWSGGIFLQLLGYIFFYIPLLTMGVMSREYSSGSINLLYASPLKNTQIIMGKFIALATFALLMVGILSVYVIHAGVLTENFDWPLVLVALFGIYLLICAYCAVGLFMSSLTSYQMVAVLSTLVVLTFFSYIGNFWQDVPFIRDVTYWLSINGRAYYFIQGVLCTEDIIYFITITTFFLCLSIFRLIFKREKKTKVQLFKYYGGLIAALMAVAFISSRPALKIYWDMIRFERNTLTKASQDVINQLKDEDITITNYTNIFDDNRIVFNFLPRTELRDMKYYSMYTRFKPDIKMEYKYYYSDKNANYPALRKQFSRFSKDDADFMEKLLDRYDIPAHRLMTEAEVAKLEDFSEEGYQTIKVVELGNGKKEYIRNFNDSQVVPEEANITASLKRLTNVQLPKVGFVSGHGVRSRNIGGSLNYDSFVSKSERRSLYNHGFNICDVDLMQPVPEDVTILLFGDMREPLNEQEMKNYQDYVDKGGDLFILGEARRAHVTNPLIEQFGAYIKDGVIVQPREGFDADLLFAEAHEECREISHRLEWFLLYPFYSASSKSAAEVVATEEKGYNVRRIMVTDSLLPAWNELETRYFEEEEPIFNAEAGEKIVKEIPLIVALDKKVGDVTQKIIIGGDGDFISNTDMNGQGRGRMTMNYLFVDAAFDWLSDGVAPIDMRRPEPIDNKFGLKEKGAKINNFIFTWIIPALVIALALLITLRRRSK